MSKFYSGIQTEYLGHTPGYSPVDKEPSLVATDVGHDKLAKKQYNPYGLALPKDSGDLDIIVQMMKDRAMQETKRNLLNLPDEE
jgi:hypothetical protein